MKIFSKYSINRRDDKKKIFVGVFLDNVWLEKFTKYQIALASLRDVKWVKSKNLHMTVFYIGPIKSEKVPQLIKSMEKVANKNSTFELEFNKFILAPQNKPATMIWATFEKNHNFTLLAEDIRKEVQQMLVMEVEEKGLLPHITLARTQRPIIVSGLKVKMKDKILTVSKIVLLESKNSFTNPEYTIIKEFELKKQ